MSRDLGPQTRSIRTTARVSAVVVVVFVGVLAFLNIIDWLGSFGFAAINIENDSESAFLGTVFFEAFGFQVTPLTILIGFFFFSLTSGIELACAAQAYSAGTNPYFAGLGAWAILVESVARKVALDAQWSSFAQPFIGSFRQVEKAQGWQGLAWIQLFFWPAMIFDAWTDHGYYSQGPLRKLAWVFTMSTFLAEQMFFVTSVLRTIVEEAEEAYGNGPKGPSFGPSSQQKGGRGNPTGGI
jgi:hypothetical protein